MGWAKRSGFRQSRQPIVRKGDLERTAVGVVGKVAQMRAG